ncbi:hypothetical protein GCM10023189_06610 [Nibrella saemangeumensis]|uniref:Cytochrome c domain-containing protein n=1 Tax=Nibrella saemangeumensis TaxID=1084526 RepID=A0ABP8MG56_9BACT
MRKLYKILGIVVLIVVVAAGGGLAYLRFVLPNVDPAPDLTVKITPERVARGKYLAHNVMSCMDCHSAKDDKAFLHPVKGPLGAGAKMHEAAFPPNSAFPNITPTGVGDWTDGELFRAITSGVRKDGSALFPMMPYDAYGQADPEDIKSVIAYLRTLPPAGEVYKRPQWEFPMSLLINTFPTQARFTKKPDPSNELAHGRYLITVAGCTHCHVQRDEKGAPVAGTEFTGGMPFKQATGGVAFSANITPDPETGIGRWTRQQFIDRFAHAVYDAEKKMAVAENQFNTTMPWAFYSGMTDEDLGAMYTYLMSLRPVAHKVDKFVVDDHPVALK